MELLGSLLAFIYCMAALHGYRNQSRFDGYDVNVSRTSEDSDFFAGVAYEESGDPAAFYFFNDTEEEAQVATKPATKPKPPQAKDHPLYQDCVDTLVTLGYNKTEAKKLSSSILESTDIGSVKEFLSEVFKREN
jgi:hypothetical protein